jgi:2'-5' RNA ligase
MVQHYKDLVAWRKAMDLVEESTRQPSDSGLEKNSVLRITSAMRLFVALDIDEAIRESIQRFMDGVCEFAPDARWLRPESVHVTLKFIGEEPAETVKQINKALAEVQSGPVTISFRGHGFFPTAKSARVFWIGIESGPELASLAAAVNDATGALGIPKEERAFSPHLTLARGGGSASPRWQKGDRSSKSFQRLQEKLSALSTPDFGTMTAREFFLYQSQTSRGGSCYTKIARFGLNMTR